MVARTLTKTTLRERLDLEAILPQMIRAADRIAAIRGERAALDRGYLLVRRAHLRGQEVNEHLY